jgi:hypothetical protein
MTAARKQMQRAAAAAAVANQLISVKTPSSRMQLVLIS